MRKIFILLFVVLTSWIAYQLYQLSVNPAEPIITTSADKTTAKSLPIKAVKADAPVVPTPVMTPVAEPAPVLLPPTPEVNPLAPCPEKIYACFGALANNIIDPTCPVYKPVWAYFSKDEGANWVKIGCYATEIDAEKAIEKAHKGVLLADKRSKEKANADLPALPPAVTVANKEVKRAQKTAEEHKAKLEERKSIAESKTATEALLDSVAEPVAEQVAPEAEKSGSATKGYVAEFKGGLGLVVMASRTYQTEEMKKKALAMWDKDMRILEPDGSINDKYMLKRPSATPMPGHY